MEVCCFFNWLSTFIQVNEAQLLPVGLQLQSQRTGGCHCPWHLPQTREWRQRLKRVSDSDSVAWLKAPVATWLMTLRKYLPLCEPQFFHLQHEKIRLGSLLRSLSSPRVL